MIILIKMEDQGILITTHVDIWQNYTEGQRKNETQESITSITKWDILQRIIDLDRR